MLISMKHTFDEVLDGDEVQDNEDDNQVNYQPTPHVSSSKSWRMS